MSFFTRWFGPSQRLTEQQYHEVVDRDFFRNASFYISFDVLWGIGTTFAMFQTVVMSYMTTLNAPKVVISFIAILSMVTTLLQLFVTHGFRRRKRKLWLTLTYAAAVIPWLLYSLFFAAFHDRVSQTLQLILFCICMVLFIGMVTQNYPLQLALMTDCAPLRKRGRFFGFRTLAQAAGVLAAFKLAAMTMDHWAEPGNFLASFIIGCSFYTFSFFCIMGVREHRDPDKMTDLQEVVDQPRYFSVLLSNLVHLLKHPRYIKFLICTVLFFVAMQIGNLIIIYAREKVALGGSSVVHLTLIQMASSAVFTMVLGKLADKVGYKMIAVIMAAFQACAFACLVLAEINLLSATIGLYAGFIIWAGLFGVYAMTVTNLSIEIMPHQESGMILAMNNVLMMPAVICAVPLAGYIIDLNDSYLTVFIAAAVISVGSLLGYLFLVSEPRLQNYRSEPLITMCPSKQE